MKTIEEAACKLIDPDVFSRHVSMVTSLCTCPQVMMFMLQISAQPSAPDHVKLLQALAIGVALGIEMEK